MLQRVKNGGRNYTFCQILPKNRGRNTTFSSFSLNIGVETIQIFQRPEKGSSKWRSICSNLHIVSTLPGGRGWLSWSAFCCQLEITWNLFQRNFANVDILLRPQCMGLLPDTYNCGLCMHRECRERFPHQGLQRKSLGSDPDMPSRHVRHVRVVIHIGIANPQWWGKRSRYSRRMRNPQFCVSGKRPKQ